MSYISLFAISFSRLFSLYFAATTFKIYIEAGFLNFCNIFLSVCPRNCANFPCPKGKQCVHDEKTCQTKCGK